MREFKREFEGEWCFPENPELKIKGTLSINDSYSFLDILSLGLGPLKKEYYQFFKSLGEKFYKADIILGEVKGEKITLMRCNGSKAKGRVQYPGITIDVPLAYYPSTVFIGTHLHKIEDTHFKNLTIIYSHLCDWANVFESSIKIPENFDKFEVEYKKPEPMKIYRDEKTLVSLVFRPSITTLFIFNRTKPSYKLGTK